MSAEATDAVWDHSRAGRGDLLVLLAIANYARPDGSNAYPSNATLQRMTRLGERAVRKNLQNLVRAGELRIRRNAGPHGCNCYDITLPGLSGPEAVRTSSAEPKPEARVASG
jgi:hypothetical protein